MRNNILLIILPLTLCSISQRVWTVNVERNPKSKTDYATVMLTYAGTMSAGGSMGVSAWIVMDTSVGIKYEIKYASSHTGIYYKFSNPYQTIVYNFNTHKSEVIKSSGSNGGADVNVMGQDSVYGYYCTHLQYKNHGESQDYWMSLAVPGFAKVVSVLNRIDPMLKVMNINQAIFNWGGLVKLRMQSVDPKTGETASFSLNLVNAQAGIPLRVGTFDPPSK